MSGYDYGYQGKPKKSTVDADADERTRKVAASRGSGISFTPISAAPFISPSSGGAFDISSYQSTLNTKPQGRATAGPFLDQQEGGDDVAVERQPSLFSWQLNQVPTLPEHFSLEQTAVLVENATPADVSSRLSAVLRERSIEATYDDEEARVRCLSSSGVDFRIRIYRSRGNQNGIIVEVQRRFGFSIDFHQDTQAILDAAAGRPSSSSFPQLANASPTYSEKCLPVPVSDDEEEDLDDDYVPSSDGAASSLQMISKMLFGNQYLNKNEEEKCDSHYLAIQILASLTDGAKMGSAGTAKCVAMQLLNPDSEVGAKVIDIVVSASNNQADYDMFHLRLLALTILANALAAVDADSTSVNMSDRDRQVLASTLLRELEQSSASNLLMAQQAARCLEYLWRREDNDNLEQWQSALETARAVGQARHSGLEQQANRTLSRILEN